MILNISNRKFKSRNWIFKQLVKVKTTTTVNIKKILNFHKASANWLKGFLNNC